MTVIKNSVAEDSLPMSFYDSFSPLTSEIMTAVNGRFRESGSLIRRVIRNELNAH